MRAGTAMRGGWAVLAALAAAVAGPALATPPRATPAPARSLHVPSPDWRDQVIYFLMTDRFDDGDPRNNDQGAGEFDRRRSGALQRRRFAPAWSAGSTTSAAWARPRVWLTPPVLNRWWDPVADHGGYHGYWASDFMRVDPHLGTLADYQRLSRKLHGAGMYLVQDIVLNHTGNWFDYEGGWDPSDPAAHFRLIADGRGASAPTQWPFSQNDARDPAQRAGRHLPLDAEGADYNDPPQVLTSRCPGSTT